MPTDKFAFGNQVADFVHGLPPNPIKGDAVSTFTQELHAQPGDPYTPPMGDLVNDVAHVFAPSDPYKNHGQAVSEWVHLLNQHDVGLGDGFLIT